MIPQRQRGQLVSSGRVSESTRVKTEHSRQRGRRAWRLWSEQNEGGNKVSSSPDREDGPCRSHGDRESRVDGLTLLDVHHAKERVEQRPVENRDPHTGRGGATSALRTAPSGPPLARGELARAHPTRRQSTDVPFQRHVPRVSDFRDPSQTSSEADTCQTFQAPTDIIRVLDGPVATRRCSRSSPA